MSRARLDSLTVGDATVRDHSVVIGGFIDAISKAAGAKMDGIIGNNFLNQFPYGFGLPSEPTKFCRLQHPLEIGSANYARNHPKVPPSLSYDGRLFLYLSNGRVADITVNKYRVPPVSGL